MANIRVAELDFDQIKTNLKNYLNSQAEFTDYDFEGSGFSVLIDLLAYNTHYNAYLANMLANEMFLDSAVKRSSVVSLAKHFNYTPTSVKGAIANINVVVNNPIGLPNSLTIERYTPFVSVINGKGYTFLTNQAKTADRIGTTYTFSGVDVIEGTYASYSYVVTDPSTTSKYKIPALNVDTSTINVIVQNSNSDTTLTVYNQVDDITGLDGNSKVYYIEQDPSGYYYIYFGDGTVGKQLTYGNIISIEYLTSNGTVGNVPYSYSQSFQASSSLGGSNSIVVSVNTNSTGGADAESITSIKFNATRLNSAKNRAVTYADYESLISANYSAAEAVSVWGGEDETPPKYGKVMVSLKPQAGYTIPQTAKDYIINNILNPKKTVAITPEFVDPIYLFVNVTANVKYNYLLTAKSSDEIKAIVNSTIASYFTTNLQKFNKNYTNSYLIEQIQNSDPSITSVLLSLKMQKRVAPILNTLNKYNSASTIKFKVPVKPSTLSSSYFNIVVNGTTTMVRVADVPNDVPSSDTGTGTLQLIEVATGTVASSNIGSINYATGEMSIDGITPVGLPANVTDIRFTINIQESSYDLSVSRNEILVQDDSTINALGGIAAGTTISITSSV